MALMPRTSAIMLSRGNLRDLYWTIGQLVTHHASNGFSLRPVCTEAVMAGNHGQ